MFPLNVYKCLGYGEDLKISFLKTKTPLNKPSLNQPYSSPQIQKIVLSPDDKVPVYSELDIEGEDKDRADWQEESSSLAPSRHVDAPDDSWQLQCLLCDLPGAVHSEDRRAV